MSTSTPPQKVTSFTITPPLQVSPTRPFTPRRIALCAALCLPFAVYLVYVWHYGVNTLYADDWSLLGAVRASFDGNLTFSTLWVQHNESRVLFPNLIAIADAHLLHLNMKAIMWLSAIMTMTSVGALTRWVWKRSTGPQWTGLIIPTLLLSPCQYQNMLWANQVAWAIVAACLIVVLLSLDRAPRINLAFGLAVCAAGVASYSQFPGLLLWPAGLAQIAVIHTSSTRRRLLAAWILAAILTSGIYLLGFNLHDLGGPSRPAHVGPISFIKFLLVLLGSVVPAGNANATNTYLILAGIGVLVASLLCTSLIIFFLKRRSLDSDNTRISAVALGLVVFSALAILTDAGARASFGVSQATQSRYTLFSLFLVVAIYLLLVTQHSTQTRAGSTWTDWLNPKPIFITLVAAQVFVSYAAAPGFARADRALKLTAADLTVNYATAPLSLLQRYDSPLGNLPIPQFRIYASFAADRHLAEFSSRLAPLYRAAGVVPDGSTARPLKTPSNARIVVSRPAWRAAWRLLSIVYSTRPDLQAAYPKNSPNFVPGILRWVAMSGLSTDTDSAYLDIYAAQFRAMLMAINSQSAATA